MADDRGEVLRRLRGTMSLRRFATLLAGSTLGTGTLSRHRLRDAESGATVLPDALWDRIAEALLDLGYDAADVAALRAARPKPGPPRPPSPHQRHAQWSRVVGHVGGNPWWSQPLRLVEWVTGKANLRRYAPIVERHGIDSVRHLRAVQARLRLGAARAGQWRPDAADRVAVDRTRSTLAKRVEPAELFLLRIRLHNTGPVPWRDRLLYRVGAPVTTGTPFTPGVLPVPDTDPGRYCEILVPGRAQWFRSLAAVHFVMVFPDLTPCLPGRLCCWTDARADDLAHADKSVPLLSDPPDPTAR